jgi:hypothetical protein
LPNNSILIEKSLPRKPWVVDEKKIAELDAKPLSPDEMI